MSALVRYEQARTALAECARIDEASEIRDKAAALAAYARQRDDRDLEVWVREIHLRACVRIGELSRDLDQAQTVREADGATAARRTAVAALPLSPDPERRARTDSEEYIYNLPDSDTVPENAESDQMASRDKLSLPKTFLKKVSEFPSLYFLSFFSSHF